MEETLKLEVGNQYQIYYCNFKGACNLLRVEGDKYIFEAIRSKRIIKLELVPGLSNLMRGEEDLACISTNVFTYSNYDDRWVQPGSYWWNFETSRNRFERLKITYRRSEVVFYINLTLNDGKERYADIHSIGITTWIPEKFYLHKSIEDYLCSVKFAPKGFPFPKIHIVNSRNDIKDKAYEYCYQPKI